MENSGKLHLHPAPDGSATLEGPPHQRRTGTLTALHESVVCVLLSTCSFLPPPRGESYKADITINVYLQSCNLVSF